MREIRGLHHFGLRLCSNWVDARAPAICRGAPVIAGSRVTVPASLAEGMDVDQVVAEFPTLTRDAVRAVIAGAAGSGHAMRLKLDENPSARTLEVLAGYGHDVDTVRDEGLTGRADADVWKATQADRRLLITQDLDFSDTRQFAPGTHEGLLRVRLREPGGNGSFDAVSRIAAEPHAWSGCFVVLTDHKLRIKRP